jgi:membrane-bound serine protease (ClpP class)
MLVGMALLAIEAFNPTVAIGLGGVIAFVLGALMLFRVEAPGYRLSWSVIAIVAATFTGFILVVLGSLRRARSAPVRVGAQAMRGLSPRSSIGQRMKVTSLRTANGGKRAAPKPSSRAR